MEVVILIAAKIISRLVEPIGRYLIEPIGRQVGYLICYKRNKKTLETEVENLGSIETRVQHRVDEARRNGELIEDDVDRWLTKVNEIKGEVKSFFEDEVKVKKRCLCSWCPSPISRYSLSRKAKKKTGVVIELKGKGSFETVSYLAPPSGIACTALEGFADFESRKSIIAEIMVALKDDKINAICICGLGGVGKTTTVKEVGKRAKTEKLFDEIVMAVVSQTPDLKKIQDEIADKLGLRFNEQSVLGRSERLRERLMQCTRVLVILDDVWARLDLEAVGIPVGGDRKVCKIMITSRSQHVCKEMRTCKNFTIGVLSGSEGWNLFKEMAGNSIDSPRLHPIAKEVVKECGGLPIAIVTVGTALSDKEEGIWKDALLQLKRSNPENISGMEKYVYRSLKLSYCFLESQEAKSCLLLCCLFGEDANIPVEDLVVYGMGLGLFKGIDGMAEARNRMCTLIDKLKCLYLLLDGDDKESVKVHDVVRDVIRFIVKEGEEVFLFGDDQEMKEWPTKGTNRKYSFLSLISNSSKIHELPDRLECPKLELLLLQCMDKVPNDFFKEMKELKVLNLRRGNFIPSLPASLSSLTKLQTLRLHRCKLKNISVIGELETLTVLSFRNSSIKELPREIGKLTHLRLLDLTGCKSLIIITPRVLSNLIRLEELYLRNTNVQWHNVNLAELGSLSQLIVLETCLPAAKLLPSINFFKKLVRFRILISTGDGQMEYLCENEIRKELILNLDARIPIESGITVLLQMIESLQLRLKGVKNVLNDLTRESLVQLKSLILYPSEGLEYLVDTLDLVQHGIFPVLESLTARSVKNLKMICHGQLQPRSFGELRNLDLYDLPELSHLWKDPTQLVSLGNLRSVKVQKCHTLKNLFSQSIARSGLEQLEFLEVEECEMIEEIFMTEREEHGAATNKLIRFPKLSVLRLRELPSFIGFCKTDEIEFPQLSTLYLYWLLELKSLCPNSLVSEGNNDTVTHHLFNQKVKSLCELRSMKVCVCNKLLNVFSSNLIQSLQNLEELRVDNCVSLEVVFDSEGMNIEQGHAALALPCLKKVNLIVLPKLTHLWKKVPPGIQGFQNLQLLHVKLCGSLKNIFTPSIAKLLVKLEELWVEECSIMEIVGKDEEGSKESEDAKKVIMFPQLNYLRLEDLPNLMSFSPEYYTFEWPVLKRLSIKKSNMKVFAPAFLGAQKQRKINAKSHEEVPEQQLTFPSLEILELGGEDEIVIQILEGLLPAESMYKLREIDVVGCNELLAIPSNLLPRLGNLEKIRIAICDSLVEVFEIVRLTVEERDNVLLSKLKHLDLGLLPKLKRLFNEKVLFPRPEKLILFPNLKVLELWHCDGLRNLLCPSMAKGLVHLERLRIRNCNLLEEIVGKGEEEEEEIVDKIEMPLLKCLELEHLKNLKSFCQGRYAFNMPSLEDVCVYDCPNMKTFSFGYLSTPNLGKVHRNCDPWFRYRNPSNFVWFGDLNSTIQELYKRELPRVKMMNDLLLGWGSNFKPSTMIRDDEEAKMEEDSFSHVISMPESSTMAQDDKEAKMEDDFLSHVISMPKSSSMAQDDKEGIFSGVFELLHNDNVERIMYNQLPAGSLRELREIRVLECEKLLTVVPSDLLQRLGNLKELSVQKCASLVDVFEVEGLNAEERDTKLLSKLKHLVLENLPELQYIFKREPRGILCFQSLSVLNVWNCYSLRNLFSASMAKSVERLKELKISYCYMMTEIIAEDKVAGDEKAINKIEFPQLRRLRLQKLPNLLSFFPKANTIASKSKSLWTKNRKAIDAVSGEVLPKFKLHTPIQHLFNEKVVFPSLEKLHLIDMNSLNEIWCSQLPNFMEEAMGFQNLKLLVVKGCGHLRNIFSLSMARGLVRLEKIIIGQCEIMEEIVVKGENEEEDRMEKIVLPQLKILELVHLPNLTCFCQGPYPFEFPSLKNVIVIDCPKMKTFSFGLLSTPKLEKVEAHDESNWMGDLNNTIQQLFSRKHDGDDDDDDDGNNGDTYGNGDTKCNSETNSDGDTDSDGDNDDEYEDEYYDYDDDDDEDDDDDDDDEDDNET